VTALAGGHQLPDTLIQTATNDVPRFDHNPTTGESLGLLVEEARTNSIFGSADFSSTYTSLTNLTATVDTAVAPDGSTTADTIAGASSTLNIKYFYKNFTTTATGAYTASIYLKANTQSIVLLRLNDNTGVNGVRQLINLSTGQLSGSVSIDGTATNPSSSITSVGNGWHRYTVTCTFNSAITSLQGPAVFHDGFTTSTSTNSYFAWGAQLEAGAFPTSYIPTTTAAATRSADVASITGTAFSSWYRQDEGVLFAQYSIPFDSSTSIFPLIATTTDGSFNNVIGLYARTVDDTRRAVVRFSGASDFDQSNNVAYVYGTSTKNALAYATNDIALVVEGASATVDNSATIPTVDRLGIGGNVVTGGALGYLNGTIRRLVFFPQRLANSTLQSITQ